jgi:hypothetical protein
VDADLHRHAGRLPGGNQSCSATLYPDSPGYPAYAGDARKPYLTISITRGALADMNVQSVVDWVVGTDVTGSGTCSLYARYHTAIEPFALGRPGRLGNAGALSSEPSHPRRLAVIEIGAKA